MTDGDPGYLHRSVDEIGGVLGLLLVGGRGRQRAVDRGASGHQRPPGPPEVQRGDVALADGFLAPRLRRDGLDGDVVFDQALVGGRHGTCFYQLR